MLLQLSSIHMDWWNCHYQAYSIIVTDHLEYKMVFELLSKEVKPSLVQLYKTGDCVAYYVFQNISSGQD